MSRERQIEEMAKYCPFLKNGKCQGDSPLETDCDLMCKMFGFVTNLIQAGYRKQSEWISVEERLPTEDEYLTRHNDGLDTLKRITIAYMTDTVEYTIGCYDGHKWMNQLGNKIIRDVIAWKPFETYEAPKMKGGE